MTPRSLGEMELMASSHNCWRGRVGGAPWRPVWQGIRRRWRRQGMPRCRRPWLQWPSPLAWDCIILHQWMHLRPRASVVSPWTRPSPHTWAASITTPHLN